MATIESIAIRIEAALERFGKAAAVVATYIGIPAPEIPTWNRSPEELRAEQLESVTAWADDLAQYAQGLTLKLPDGVTEVEAPDYDRMTRAELEAMIAERGIDLVDGAGSGSNGAYLVRDLVAVLRENDATPDEKDAP